MEKRPPPCIRPCCGRLCIEGTSKLLLDRVVYCLRGIENVTIICLQRSQSGARGEKNQVFVVFVVVTCGIFVKIPLNTVREAAKKGFFCGPATKALLPSSLVATLISVFFRASKKVLFT